MALCQRAASVDEMERKRKVGAGKLWEEEKLALQASSADDDGFGGGSNPSLSWTAFRALRLSYEERNPLTAVSKPVTYRTVSGGQ